MHLQSATLIIAVTLWVIRACHASAVQRALASDSCPHPRRLAAASAIPVDVRCAALTCNATAPVLFIATTSVVIPRAARDCHPAAVRVTDGRICRRRHVAAVVWKRSRGPLAVGLLRGIQLEGTPGAEALHLLLEVHDEVLLLTELLAQLMD